MGSKTKVIPIFIPHEGCPHNCVFCNQKKISGSVKSPNSKDIIDEIELALETIDRSDSIILAFYGGSFTAIDIARQREYLSIARHYKVNHKIDKIRLSTRPDYMRDENVKLLKDFGVDHVELGIQSTDSGVLNLSRRYYALEEVNNAVSNLKRYQIDYGFQIMPGLPGDTRDKFVKTCFDLLPMAPSTLRIYPTVVVAGTELEDLYRVGKYTPLSLDDAIEWSIIAYVLFKQIGCEIIRVGLHPSQSLLYGDNVVGGPFHSAFGELVQSRIYYKLIANGIREYRLEGKSILIASNDKNFSKISGNRGYNRRLLREVFNVNFKFQNNPVLDDDIIIKCDGRDYFLSVSDYYEKLRDDYKRNYP